MPNSIFPAQLDNSQTLIVCSDNLTNFNADIPNSLRSAILAIESNIGLGAAATYTTISARLNAIESSGGAPTGNAGGDLAGTYPNPTVISLSGTSGSVSLLNGSGGSQYGSISFSTLPISATSGVVITGTTSIGSGSVGLVSASSAPIVISANSSLVYLQGSEIKLYSSELVFNNTTSSTITQDTQTSNIPTTNIILQPQAPFASATGLNVVPGDVVVNFPAPISGNNFGAVQIQSNSVSYAQWQIVNNLGLGTAPAPSLYFGTAPSTTSNWFASGLGTTNFINASTELGLGIGGSFGSSIDIKSAGIQLFNRTQSLGGGTNVLGISNASVIPTSAPSSGVILYSNSGALETYATGFQFNSNQTNPTITQTTISGAATNLTIQAQNSSSSIGGNLIISAGTGITNGTIDFFGSQNVSVSTLKIVNYQIVKGDYIVIVGTNVLTAPITITLPASPITGDTYFIKDVTGSAELYNITILPSSGTIDGAANYIMNVNYENIPVTYTGLQWSIV